MIKHFIFLAFFLSVTGCGSGVRTGVDTLDNITGAKSACDSTFTVVNNSSQTVIMTATMNERLMDAHCSKSFDEGKQVIAPGGIGRLNLATTCQRCGSGFVRRGISVEAQQPSGTKQMGLKEGESMICTDSGCS